MLAEPSAGSCNSFTPNGKIVLSWNFSVWLVLGDSIKSLLFALEPNDRAVLRARTSRPIYRNTCAALGLRHGFNPSSVTSTSLYPASEDGTSAAQTMLAQPAWRRQCNAFPHAPPGSKLSSSSESARPRAARASSSLESELPRARSSPPARARARALLGAFGRTPEHTPQQQPRPICCPAPRPRAKLVPSPTQPDPIWLKCLRICCRPPEYRAGQHVDKMPKQLVACHTASAAASSRAVPSPASSPSTFTASTRAGRPPAPRADEARAVGSASALAPKPC